jgi:hypothetical protein
MGYQHGISRVIFYRGFRGLAHLSTSTEELAQPFAGFANNFY